MGSDRHGTLFGIIIGIGTGSRGIGNLPSSNRSSSRFEASRAVKDARAVVDPVPYPPIAAVSPAYTPEPPA